MAMRRVPLKDLVRAGIVAELNIVLAKHGMTFIVEQGQACDFDRMWVEFAEPPKRRGFVPWNTNGHGEGPEED